MIEDLIYKMYESEDAEKGRGDSCSPKLAALPSRV